jgi:hypothetical protein
MIRHTFTECIYIWMEPGMRVNGKKIDKMEMGRSLGLMAHSIVEIMLMGKSMGMGNFNGRMDQFIKANSLTITLKVMEPMLGQTEGYSKDNGKKTRCMGKACSHGVMEGNMKEHT